MSGGPQHGSAEQPARCAPDGAWLRAQRQGRGWDVREMARQLTAAAAGGRESLPGLAVLAGYIRGWEQGRCGTSERYRLLYRQAFGIPLAQLGSTAAEPSAHAGASTAALRAFAAAMVAAREEFEDSAAALRLRAAAEHDGVAAARLTGEATALRRAARHLGEAISTLGRGGTR